jgi:hypothetical protein
MTILSKKIISKDPNLFGASYQNGKLISGFKPFAIGTSIGKIKPCRRKIG